MVQGGGVEYLVKWEGFPEDDATWEPQKNILCPQLIHEYDQKRRLSGNAIVASRISADHPVGRRAPPSVYECDVFKNRHREFGFRVSGEQASEREFRQLFGKPNCIGLWRLFKCVHSCSE